MSRYIDADALKDKITDLDGGCAVDGTGFDIYTCEVFELIGEVPTADVVEVVHGEWVLNDDQVYECKDCGYVPSFDGYTYYNYCPNCGAKMDLQ